MVPYPIVKTSLDLTLSRVIDYHILSQLLGALSVQATFLGTAKEAFDAFSNGISASALAAAGGLAVFFATSLDGEVAGAVVDLAQVVAAAAGYAMYGWKTVQYISYLYGMLIPPVLGIPCALQLQCLPDIPGFWTNTPGSPVPDVPQADGLWAGYEFIGVIGPLKVINDYFPAMELAAAILIPAVLIALQT
jgi:hypothetical protein